MTPYYAVLRSTDGRTVCTTSYHNKAPRREREGVRLESKQFGNPGRRVALKPLYLYIPFFVRFSGMPCLTEKCGAHEGRRRRRRRRRRRSRGGGGRNLPPSRSPLLSPLRPSASVRPSAPSSSVHPSPSPSPWPPSSFPALTWRTSIPLRPIVPPRRRRRYSDTGRRGGRESEREGGRRRLRAACHHQWSVASGQSHRPTGRGRRPTVHVVQGGLCCFLLRSSVNWGRKMTWA